MVIQSLKRSPLLLATLGIWLLSWTVWTLDGAALHMSHQFEIDARGAITDSAGVLLCGLMYLVLQRLEGRPAAVRLVVALVLAVAATAAFMSWLYAVYFVIQPMADPGKNWMARNADTIVAILWTFLAWCGVYFSLGFGRQLQERETRLREAEAMAMDAQNRMLRYQLDPHFLFNIHSALATLIHDGRNAEAERMVLALSTFLRRSLDKDPLAHVSVAEELDVTREYLGIEAIRFGKRLSVVERIDRDVEQARAPSFILQPLVENAIKHGLGRSARPIVVEIGARRQDGALELWIEDDGEGAQAGAPTGANGVGLENVRRRLQALYGELARVTAEPCLPRGFRVTLRLPLEAA
jgi:two-component system LytT family sensor kinase